MADGNAQEAGTRRLTKGAVALWLVVSWLWVGVPLAWGVRQTVIQSLDLFK